jgi:hypothetical protein
VVLIALGSANELVVATPPVAVVPLAAVDPPPPPPHATKVPSNTLRMDRRNTVVVCTMILA